MSGILPLMLKPSEVFVPGRFPIEEHNVYADRGEPQVRVRRAWERGFAPVIYGSYGTGKSSLARFCAKPYQDQGRLVYIESVYGKSLADLFENVLEFIGYTVTVETISSSEKQSGTEAGFEVAGGVLAALKATIRGKLSRKRKKALAQRRQLLVKSPTDRKMLNLCEERGIVLLVDELHRASDSFREELSAFMKAYANRNAKKFRIGLIGTEDDASRLIIRDPGIDRLLQEVSVPPIKEDEARKIIIPGMERLGIEWSERIVKKTVSAGVGSPFIVQYLCLEMAEMAFENGSKELRQSMFEEALKRYARAKAQRSLKQYHRAIETTGPKRYRKQILHAMARIEHDFVTMNELAGAVSDQLGEEIPSTTLSGPLRDLKSKDYGAVLSDVPGFLPDTRAFNYSTFSDPAMKAVVRLVEELGGDITPYVDL